MKLYLVVYDTEDGDPLDMFVSADSPEQAEALWHACWELDAGEMPGVRVFPVPQVSGVPMVHPWDMAHVPHPMTNIVITNIVPETIN